MFLQTKVIFTRLIYASKKLEQINPSSEKIAYGGAAFSKDGKGIFYYFR